MPESKPDHLLVLVHGLADTLHAWDNCLEELRTLPSVLLLASAVNARFRTHDGFDKCGERLAEEIREIVSRHPLLAKVSVVGHSMGGMIARYALGTLFDPSTGTICGLKPMHYVTLATPHLGLTVDDGPAQVPFVSWAGQIPLVGSGLKTALQAAAHSVARSLFRGTGRHFLALDGGPGELPLLMLLAMDAPDRQGGQYFYSALAAFASRACYGNVGRDHWVSWENATIRATEELPAIPPDVVRQGRGVVWEDPPEAGITPALLATASAASSNEASRIASADACCSRPDDAACTSTTAAGFVKTVAMNEGAAATEPPYSRWAALPGSAGRVEDEAGRGSAADSAGGAFGTPGQAEAVALEKVAESAVEAPQQVVSFALARLRRLPWRRVDVSFAGARIGTAHNNIQATRWTNRVGLSVLAHLRAHLQVVDQLLAAAAEGRGLSDLRGKAAGEPLGACTDVRSGVTVRGGRKR